MLLLLLLLIIISVAFRLCSFRSNFCRAQLRLRLQPPLSVCASAAAMQRNTSGSPRSPHRCLFGQRACLGSKLASFDVKRCFLLVTTHRWSGYS